MDGRRFGNLAKPSPKKTRRPACLQCAPTATARAWPFYVHLSEMRNRDQVRTLFRYDLRQSEHLAPGPPFGQGFVRLRRQEQRQRQRGIAVLERDREDV